MKQSRKIPIKKRENSKQKSTTFTKRRCGLFSKAADLCVLFGVQVAILVKSINSKHGDVYCFGHSSVDKVLEAFLNNGVPEPVDNQTNKSAVALYNQCLALRKGKKKEDLSKKREKKMEDSSEFSLQFENLSLDDIQSIEKLSLVVERIKALKENVKNRLNSLRSAENDVASSSGSKSASFVTLTAPVSNNNGNNTGLFADGDNCSIVTNVNHQKQSVDYYDDLLSVDPLHLQVYDGCDPSLSCVSGSSFVNGLDYNNMTATASNSAYSGFNHSVQIGGGECSDKNTCDDLNKESLEVMGKVVDAWLDLLDEM